MGWERGASGKGGRIEGLRCFGEDGAAWRLGHFMEGSLLLGI
jgi:hypothetical protein